MPQRSLPVVTGDETNALKKWLCCPSDNQHFKKSPRLISSADLKGDLAEQLGSSCCQQLYFDETNLQLVTSQMKIMDRKLTYKKSNDRRRTGSVWDRLEN